MEEIPAQLKTQIEENNSDLEDGKYPYYVTLHELDQESFQAYVETNRCRRGRFCWNKTHLSRLSLSKFPMKITQLEKWLKQNQSNQKLEIALTYLQCHRGYGE